jgi:predicted RNase H-like nuclease (RuvC/YqgF family)
MKRVIFGACLALAVASCGGTEEAVEEVVVENEVNAEAVLEVENKTKAVEEGLNKLEENVTKMNHDVDSLLNGI